MGFFLPLCFVSVFWALTFLLIRARVRVPYNIIYTRTRNTSKITRFLLFIIFCLKNLKNRQKYGY